jgi:PBP1b-binding outer membrane lipoprotein LpoB
MTRAALLIAALALSGCIKPAEILKLAPTPEQLCVPFLRGTLIRATNSDPASVGLACALVN